MSIHANKLAETQETLTRKEEAEETNGTKENEANNACLDKSRCLDMKKVLEDNSEDTAEDLKDNLSDNISCHATKTETDPVFEQFDKTQSCSSTPMLTFVASPKEALKIGIIDLEIQDQPPGLGN